jgi:hypothetical protein
MRSSVPLTRTSVETTKVNGSLVGLDPLTGVLGEVLQLCDDERITWSHVAGPLDFRSVQMAPLAARIHHAAEYYRRLSEGGGQAGQDQGRRTAGLRAALL